MSDKKLYGNALDVKPSHRLYPSQKKFSVLDIPNIADNFECRTFLDWRFTNEAQTALFKTPVRTAL